MSALKQHPLSAAFPAMPADELRALAADIELHGLRQPVVTFEGQVLDGWHRYQACLEVEREPSFVEFDGTDPRAFVISQNAHRRQLTQSQKAIAIAKVADWKAQGSNQFTGGSAPGAEALAESAGVSTRTLHQAKAADRAGLAQPVIDGKVSAKTAAAVAALPPKERAKVAAKPPEDWVEELARKSPPKEPTEEQEAALDDTHERFADLAADFESALRIIEADDKLTAAWDEVKTLSRKYEELERLYESQRRELAEMTREAKRWMKKAQALEKGRAA